MSYRDTLNRFFYEEVFLLIFTVVSFSFIRSFSRTFVNSEEHEVEIRMSCCSLLKIVNLFCKFVIF